MSSILVQVIVGGLLLGAVYALFSSGLTLIWGMMNIVNFAHGDFVMLGMYVAFVVWTVLGVGPFVGAPVAALVLATLGIIVYFGLIRSVMKGVVIFANWAGPYGRQVQVRHEDGTVTWYNHMSKFSVSVGETVYAGDQVGAIGMTGNTTGPHLHFEVHPDGGSAIDPAPWLRNHCGLDPYTAG